MNSTGRVTASLDAVIDAPAARVWQILTDWGGFPLRAQMPGVTDVSLVGGNSSVPRTRTLSFAGGAAVREELFHQDDLTRRLYCRTIGDEVMGLRGYVATVFVDETTDSQCTVSLYASCDVPDATTIDMARDAIQTGWSTGIIDGIRRCLADDGRGS